MPIKPGLHANHIAQSASDDRLRALEDRAARIKAQIAAIEARQASRNRKDETRTKVLVGAAMLADSALHEETRNGMRAVLARAITAPRDRDFLRSRGLID